jgi:Fe2+ transport system protein FeoA
MKSSEPEDCTLRDLHEHDCAVVVDCSQCPVRLQELGLIEGRQIEVLRFAPFGDTVAIRVGESVICVRCSECPIRLTLSKLSP